MGEDQLLLLSAVFVLFFKKSVYHELMPLEVKTEEVLMATSLSVVCHSDRQPIPWMRTVRSRHMLKIS